MDNNLAEQICQAIDIIANKDVASAQYDKTIQALVLSCLDESSGLYRIKYQDATFEAYSANLNTLYTAGTTVYILVEKGDLSKKKTITGSVDNLGASPRNGNWIYL